jgi:hypothetical protein
VPKPQEDSTFNFATSRQKPLDCPPLPSTSKIMSWRSNAGQTGANTIPLGKRRFGDDESPAAEPPRDMKRGRSPERRAPPELNPDGTKKRRKRNRWGDASDNKAAGLMNLPTAITAPMTAEQLDAYVTHLRIEEISQKLRINDVVPADGDRYVIPLPIELHANTNRTLAAHPLPHPSTTTSENVSTLANTATERSWKMSVTSRLRRR